MAPTKRKSAAGERVRVPAGLSAHGPAVGGDDEPAVGHKAGVLVCMFAVGLVYFGAKAGLWTGAGTARRLRPVPTSVWTQNPTEFANVVSEQRTAVVLKATAATELPAVGRWSLDYLRKHGPKQMRAVNQHDKPVFLYHDETKEFAPLPELAWTPPHAVADRMPLGEFVGRLEEPRTDRFLYFSHRVRSLGPAMEQDLRGIERLLAVNGSELESVNVWIGSPGVVAHMHYDPTDNFYLQIAGRKRWTLVPPSMASAMHLYPFLHPSDRQSQIDFRKPDRKRFPAAERALKHALQVTIGPGDVLYVPPFWFHMVEALDVSISANVWTYSWEADVLDQVFTIPPPADKAWSRPERAQAAVRLVDDVLERIFHGHSRGFLQSLLINRYNPLFPQRISDRELCLEDAAAGGPPMDFSAYVDTVGALFDKLPIGDANATGIREILAGHLVEHLVNFAVGPRNVVRWFRECV